MKCPRCGHDLNNRVTEKNRKVALMLIEQGFQNSAIARLIGVSKTTVGRWVKGHKNAIQK